VRVALDAEVAVDSTEFEELVVGEFEDRAEVHDQRRMSEICSALLFTYRRFHDAWIVDL
jgi:hypothetical protein